MNTSTPIPIQLREADSKSLRVLEQTIIELKIDLTASKATVIVAKGVNYLFILGNGFVEKNKVKINFQAKNSNCQVFQTRPLLPSCLQQQCKLQLQEK